jgi:site-specific recombinase
MLMDRSEEFRRAAAECLALLPTSTDESSRARLLTMAQKWFAWADEPCGTDRLESLLREFNDRQMIQH